MTIGQSEATGQTRRADLVAKMQIAVYLTPSIQHLGNWKLYAYQSLQSKGVLKVPETQGWAAASSGIKKNQCMQI
uniref:Uncharacterized protein n=1 Tax=Anguilla anguilla TaxID=7936 RepID=A0A0E9PM66_ANGAN